MVVWLLLLALPLGGALTVAIGALWLRRHRPCLTEVDPSLDTWPTLSVVAPCRDEEEAVERSARSLLAQDYPRLEVVFVDDRSTDRTGAILDALAAGDPRLRAVHVSELPDGWIGKSHACQRGGEAATGEWLLFTDGDVVFEPGALRRAVTFAERHGLGHLVVLPRFDAPGFLERAFVSTFGVAALLEFQPWALHRPRTRAHIGVGAGSLVRAEAWRAVGGHAVVRYEVVEDVKLGLVLRRSGVPQGAVESGGLVHLRWNAGAIASMRGLLKNGFAGAEYRWDLTLLGAAALLAAALLPWAAVLSADGAATRTVGALTGVLTVAVHAGAARSLGRGSGLEGLLHPVTQTCLALVLVASAVVTTVGGGVRWRSTFYPLAELRRRCVRRADWPVSAAVGWPSP